MKNNYFQYHIDKIYVKLEQDFSDCPPVCDGLYVHQYELATGRFPYPKWNSVFDQLTQVVRGDPPQLSNSDERRFSPKFIAFVNVW